MPALLANQLARRLGREKHLPYRERVRGSADRNCGYGLAGGVLVQPLALLPQHLVRRGSDYLARYVLVL